MRLTCFLVVFAACATTSPRPPSGGPRGLHATDHVALAREHDDRASRERVWPDAMSSQPGTPGVWFRSWDTSEHERLAALHRARATELDRAYEELCAGFPAAESSVSPLRRYGIGSWNTASGVIMYLTPDVGSPDRLLALMKCHRAWMMLAPADMDDCALDLPGLALDARGDAGGVTVAITVANRRLVGELQRRVAVELESR